MWYLTLSSIIICILYVTLSRIYLRRKWSHKDNHIETHLSVKNELSTWDDNRKVFFNVGLMIAMACVLMASDIAFEPSDEPAPLTEPIDDPFTLISITVEPEVVKPKPEPKPEPIPEVKPPPVVIQFKPVAFTPPEPKPIIRKVETPVALNPVSKPKVVKVKSKPKPKPIVKPPPAPKPPKVYEKHEIDSPPTYPGGYGELRTFIQNNVKYSAICRENEIQGKVFVRFVVNERGEVKDVALARGRDCAIDKEAIEVIKKLPKWEPGMKQNKAVSVNMVVPIDFRLE